MLLSSLMSLTRRAEAGGRTGARTTCQIFAPVSTIANAKTSENDRVTVRLRVISPRGTASIPSRPWHCDTGSRFHRMARYDFGRMGNETAFELAASNIRFGAGVTREVG